MTPINQSSCVIIADTKQEKKMPDMQMSILSLISTYDTSNQETVFLKFNGRQDEWVDPYGIIVSQLVVHLYGRLFTKNS